MRTALRNTIELIASFGAMVITCTINMDQNKSDLALYLGGASKENMKAKAKMSVKRQSLKIQTIEKNRRPKLLEKMGRDLSNLYLWNRAAACCEGGCRAGLAAGGGRRRVRL